MTAKPFSPWSWTFSFPQASVALEVNDFYSHNKESDSIPFAHGGFKRGPSYHERKRELCHEHNIELLFLWEDEIKNVNSYEVFMGNLVKKLYKER